MSGGTEGGLSPHFIVFEVRDSDAAPERRAPSRSAAPRRRPLPPEASRPLGQVDAVAEGVRAAMADAGIADPADVHLVQVKCPLLTSDRIAEARGARRRAPRRATR